MYKIFKKLDSPIIEFHITKWPWPSSQRFLHIVFPWRKDGKIRRIIITNFWRWFPKYQTYGLINFLDV